MSIFHPDHLFRRIYEIPTDFFVRRGVKVLLIDVDNTLTTDNNPTPHQEVLAWLDTQRRAGLELMAFSNNSEARVAPFARQLGLDYVADAQKPLPGRVKAALAGMGVDRRQAAIIGDQLFTDILCGRLVGCTTVLVEPMERENYGFYRVKRPLEERILRSYRARRQGGGR